MNILIVLTYYYPHWTGLSQYAKLLAEGLVSLGEKVHVLTTNHTTTLKAQERIEGVSVQRCRPLFTLSRTIVSLELILKLPKLIRDNDRIVVFLPSNDIVFVTIYCLMFRKKLYVVHNGDLVLPQGLVNKFIEQLYHLLTDICLRFCTNIIVLTMDYAQQSKLLLKHKNKWKQIYPPIVPLQSNATDIRMMKKKIHAGPIIGVAGRFVEEKGFDILLKAIPLVVKHYPQVQFVYAGAKVSYERFYESCEELIQQAGNHFIFLGKLERSSMGSFYTMCDTFVISSRSDCFPFVQIEALLSGVPVVVTNIPGARVPVAETQFGEIVEAENPQALARGIVTVLKNTSAYQKHHTKVLKMFNAQTSLKEYMEVFYE